MFEPWQRGKMAVKTDVEPLQPVPLKDKTRNDIKKMEKPNNNKDSTDRKQPPAKRPPSEMVRSIVLYSGFYLDLITVTF